MDTTKKSVLRKYRENIVADLEVNDILDDLFSKFVISSDEREKISAQNERKFRSRCLLDILSQKGNEEYTTFVDVLDKDYDWLAKDLKTDIGCVSEIEYEVQIYSEALTLGDVPQLPLHYVSRTSELNQIVEDLQRLKRGHFIVLHGMAGSGKSVLAVSAIRNPDLLKNSFNNCMYFINAGEAKSELDAANLLYRLYAKLVDDCKEFDLNVAFDKNGIALMKDRLKKLFLIEARKEALLILDDVCSENLIHAFDFGCKILVTTQDLSLVPREKSRFFEISKGFKEAESLQLFSSCVKLKIEDLPIETKKIHDLCKGAPLVISLIGADFELWKEEAKSKERWNYYINMLIDKKDGGLDKVIQMFFSRKRERENQKTANYLFNTIKHCLKSLPENYQDYYKHFALFVEDVNITPRVMEIILKKSKYEVEEIVTELKNKSLIVCAYNVELKSYVYGIHDLLLAHLKQSLSPEELVSLHEKAVENYLEVSDNNFANLPNDNYIFTYIGYHLLEAKRFEDFPKVYFDLNFIGAKIKAVGIAGLVGDFVRYRKYITRGNDPDLSEKLDKFESFVQKYGQDLHRYPNTDIIQCGLQQPINSEVHEAALQIALKQCTNTLYLQTQFFGHTVYVTHTLDLKEDVCATCFAHQTNTILVGTNSGEIHLWDHSYKSKLRTFSGHSQKILYLQLSPDASKFLSVSEDGSVKVWSLEDCCIKRSDQIYDENGFNMHTPPPAIHQKSWMNFFGDPVVVDRSQTFHLPGDALTAAAFDGDNRHLLAGSQNGVVVAWDLETNTEVFHVAHSGHPVTCCTFSLNNSLVLFACENMIAVYDFLGQEYQAQFMNDVRTTSLLVVPYAETKIVAVSDKSVTIWEWQQRDRLLTFNKPEKNQKTQEMDDRRSVESTGRGIQPTGGMIEPPERMIDPSGRIINSSGRMIDPSRRVTDPSGRMIDSSGRMIDPSGRMIDSSGRMIDPSRRVTDPSGRMIDPSGRMIDSSGRMIEPSGRMMNPRRRTDPCEDLSEQRVQKERQALGGVPGGSVRIFDPQSFVLDSREDAYFICGAVTWDGVYLVAGSSDHCISMWNIETKKKVKEMSEQNGLVVSLDTFLNQESNSNVMYILLSGSDNKTVKQWRLHEIETENHRSSKLLPHFSACWLHGPIPLIAAVNSENRVQVFSGHALISESEILDHPKCLCFSPCGAQIAIGLSNGIVKIFNFRSRKYWSIMNLEGPVTYIEYLEDNRAKSGSILVASSENTCLMAYKDGESSRFKKPESESNIRKGKSSKTIKCFALVEIQRILSVEENGSVKLWYFNCIEDVLLVVKEPHAMVTMATMTPKRDFLALTFSEPYYFRVFELFKSNLEPRVSCIYSQGNLMDGIPRCCTFSNDGKLLAVGQDSGNIVIWSIENKKHLKTLELHKSWVRNLYFSPCGQPGAPLVLLSVGDQIAWWDITHVWITSTDHIRRSSRSRGSARFSSPESLTVNVFLPQHLIDSSWIGKKGREPRRELLAAIKLAGVHAPSVSVAPNFTCFVTVDSSGLLYIMNVLRPTET